MNPVAPSVTHGDVIAAIEKETYTVLPNGLTTICQLTLYNDFTVEGSSACVSKENFDPVKGRQFARDKAVNKVWELLGFRLADQLYSDKHWAAACPAEVVPEVVEDLAGFPAPPVDLGEQVMFYEQVGDQVSPPMLALVTQVSDARTVSLVVFAPNGTTHSRTDVLLISRREPLLEPVPRFARRAW